MPRVGLKGPPPQKQRGRMQLSPRRPQPRTQEPAVPKPQPLVLQGRGAERLGWAVIRHGATNILRYLRGPRAVSSVGSEHLVYTEGVGGSSPSPPTQIPPQRPLHCRGFLMPETGDGFVKPFGYGTLQAPPTEATRGRQSFSESEVRQANPQSAGVRLGGRRPPQTGFRRPK